jgi:zinc transporter ZupT
VEVQVRDAVAGVWAGVDNAAIASLGQAFEASDFSGSSDDCTDDGIVLGLERFGVVDVLVRHHQHVGGQLRIDVAEGRDLVVLEDDSGRNAAADDLAEDAIGI